MTTPTSVDRHIDVTVVRDVAVLTLDRPEKLNALTVDMRRRLAALVREHGTGATVRGLVLTGRGRAFSAGEDLQHAPTTESEVHAAFESFHDVTRAILQTRVPVVAAINGLAVGGASEITLCCDARIGTPATEYFQPENARGLTISNATSLLLRRLVGNHAMRMVLASPRVASAEALRIGRLDEVVDADRLIERAVDAVHEWTPEGNTTALHLALLRPLAAEVEAAFEREDHAAHEAWTSGLLTAGVAGFWNTRETTA